MRLHCEFSTPVARTDLDDYIRHLEINIGCYDEDALKEYVVGKLAVDQILWMDALVDGISLFDICDSDSQGLHEVHKIVEIKVGNHSSSRFAQHVQLHDHDVRRRQISLASAAFSFTLKSTFVGGKLP